MSDQSILTRFAHACAETASSDRRAESLADEALLAATKLRELLVHANHNTAACLVDDAISSLEDACRKVWPR